jgi:hypothetical protein
MCMRTKPLFGPALRFRSFRRTLFFSGKNWGANAQCCTSADQFPRSSSGRRRTIPLVIQNLRNCSCEVGMASRFLAATGSRHMKGAMGVFQYGLVNGVGQQLFLKCDHLFD